MPSENKGDQPKRWKFKRCSIGYLQIGIAERRTAEGKHFLFVAIDQIGNFAAAQLVEKVNWKTRHDISEMTPGSPMR